MTRELTKITDYNSLLEFELEAKTKEIDTVVGELRQCELRKQMSEVERSEYERVIEEQEKENSGLKQELIELRAHLNQIKELQRRMIDVNGKGENGSGLRRTD